MTRADAGIIDEYGRISVRLSDLKCSRLDIRGGCNIALVKMDAGSLIDNTVSSGSLSGRSGRKLTEGLLWGAKIHNHNFNSPLSKIMCHKLSDSARATSD